MILQNNSILVFLMFSVSYIQDPNKSILVLGCSNKGNSEDSKTNHFHVNKALSYKTQEVED